MQAFKTHFPVKGVRTDVTVTPVEENMFAIELESADAFEEDRDPKHETLAGMKEPSMIVQKTKSQDWVILNEGSLNLDQEDLAELGRAIENNSSNLV
ncbi:MAG TPA: hypothetical protein VGB63_01105 [Pedobacter sp.]|jgi:hypothetical protein